MTVPPSPQALGRLAALLFAVSPISPVRAAEPSLTPPPPPPAGAAATAGSATATVTGTRQILLELGKRQISLLEGEKLLGRWPVAIGDPSTPTPVGRFQVENKVLNPRYQSTRSGKINALTGPQAPLGDRWIGFKQSGVNQYGIHGTPDAWAWTVTSRAAVSNGCVRMLTPHVRQLFDQVDVGTPVVVKP
jgi:lipoprotein-anchoring transpeptidase ErfK/SrfK